MKTLKIIKLLISIIFISGSIYYLLNPTPSTFIDNVNLLIHEAGHLILSMFGEFVMMIGGTLFQLAVPILFFSYFLIKKEFYSASIILFWIGQNLCNISVYAGDALDMNLHLFGGDNVTHDWNFILTNINQLQNTYKISKFIYFLSVLCVGVASFWSIKESLKSQDSIAI